jgi:hypothetical protein
VEVLRDHDSSVIPIHVMQHEGRQAPQKVRAFLDMAIKTLRAGAAFQ